MLNLIEFEQQLANCTTTEQVAEFIRTFNVSAPNTTDTSTSVFYTKSIDGNPTNPMWQIANAIQAEGNGKYKVLNNSTDVKHCAPFYCLNYRRLSIMAELMNMARRLKL